MDIHYPYASGQARLQLLYCLPIAGAPQRLLIVDDGSEFALPADGWPGEVRRIDLPALLSTPTDAAQRFDAVALPGLLGRPVALRQGSGNLALLAAASRWAAPGGRVIGHMPQLRALRCLLRSGGLPRLLAAQFEEGAISSPAACVRVLRQAGFAAPQCFYVQPSISEPMALVPSHDAAARAHFLRAIRSSASAYSMGGYLARLALAGSGLGGLLQEHLFFWAQKPC